MSKVKRNNEMAMHFEHIFISWLNQSLTEIIPSEVKAFCFSLYLPAGEAGITFGIELIGANNFDHNNEDWACNEIWEPTQRQLFIPTSYSTDNWETCQLKMKTLIEKYLSAKNPSSLALKQRKAVAIGFVDGNLELIWVSS